MKKLFPVIMALFLIFSLCACDTSSGEVSGTPSESVSNTKDEVSSDKVVTSYNKGDASSDKDDTPSVPSSFTNKYGTRTTFCAHSGCSNYIASSGDTNCCVVHSKKCLECHCYIDEDAAYCLSCIKNAINDTPKANTHTCEECGANAPYSIEGITGQTEYYCYKHYKELKELMDDLLGN